MKILPLWLGPLCLWLRANARVYKGSGVSSDCESTVKHAGFDVLQSEEASEDIVDVSERLLPCCTATFFATVLTHLGGDFTRSERSRSSRVPPSSRLSLATSPVNIERRPSSGLVPTSRRHTPSSCHQLLTSHPRCVFGLRPRLPPQSVAATGSLGDRCN